MHRLLIILLAITPLHVLSARNPIDSRTEKFLTSMLEKTRTVDSVGYDLLKRLYEPTDSFHISENAIRCIECRNPADTSGLASFVEWNKNGRQFSRSYFGDSVYFSHAESGYIASCDGINFGYKAVSPSFFNLVGSALDYFLTSDREIKIDITDCVDSWRVRGDIPCDVARISFYGKARETMSFPYPECFYDIMIGKSDSLPRSISFLLGNPPFREELICSNVNQGGLTPHDFSLEAVNCGSLPVYDNDDMRASALFRKGREGLKRMLNGPAPDFEVIDTDGNTLNLTGYGGRILMLLFTSVTCPHAWSITPVLNQLDADYSPRGVSLLGVHEENTIHPQALRNHRERKGITYPLASDPDGKVKRDYMTGGLTPMLFIIDNHGTVRRIFSGAGRQFETDVRETLDTLLSETPEVQKALN